MPRLKKSLGQHHLVDGRLCRPLVEFLAPEGQRVLEIGPGGGVLTEQLLAAGASVTAWELDLEWAFELRRRQGSGGLALVVGDALGIAWPAIPPGTLVAGNLPYQVGTAILRKMLAAGNGVPRAAFLLQREVVDRIVAEPGSKVYGALSVEVAARARARILGRVRPGSFRPPPKVDSAFVGLERRPPPVPEADVEALIALVQQAFSQRRKTLRNSLGSAWGKREAEAVLERAGIDPGARAETLSLDQFCALYRAHGGRVAPGARAILHPEL